MARPSCNNLLIHFDTREEYKKGTMAGGIPHDTSDEELSDVDELVDTQPAPLVGELEGSVAFPILCFKRSSHCFYLCIA